ncbi:MAG TPA: SDR family NAD(P)-dependent oxidoreductase [Bacteroidales bacterium]|nr:SDR family NAD(P)-dependent oxidoreductase [Bacteroidales bacterium]
MHQPNHKSYALITGASRGLGKEIAEELAMRGINLLLVSLKNEGLADLGHQLSKRNKIEVKHIEADLCESNTVFHIAEWAKAAGPVSILVNNAGMGGTYAFEQAPVEYIDNIIQLNIRATSLLTRLMLPVLKCQPSAYILNVSSLASFSPVAYKTVYPASKAFIWSFSRGLYEELKNTSVFVSVVHPGPMRTNADVTNRIASQSLVGRLGVMSTRETATIAVNKLFARRTLIIPGFFNKVNWLMTKIFPLWLRLIVLSKVMKKEIRPFSVIINRTPVKHNL